MNDELLIMVFYGVFCKMKHRQQNSSELLKSYLMARKTKPIDNVYTESITQLTRYFKAWAHFLCPREDTYAAYSP